MSADVIFWTALVVGFSGAMMPGPLMTVTIAEVARRGFWAGPLIVLGHVVLETVLFFFLVVGVGEILASEQVTTVVAVVGGVLLAWMGWGMLRDARAGRVAIDTGVGSASNAGGTGLHPVWAGALVSLANPYWSLWWATVGVSYVTISLGKGWLGLASFFSGHILADLVWYCVVAAAVTGGRSILSPPVYRFVIGACGLFLVGLGAYFFTTGIT